MPRTRSGQYTIGYIDFINHIKQLKQNIFQNHEYFVVILKDIVKIKGIQQRNINLNNITNIEKNIFSNLNHLSDLYQKLNVQINNYQPILINNKLFYFDINTLKKNVFKKDLQNKVIFKLDEYIMKMLVIQRQLIVYIKNLKRSTIKLKQEHFDNDIMEEPKCGICCDEICSKEKIEVCFGCNKQLKVKHVFHSQCLEMCKDNQLKSDFFKAYKCPYCRQLMHIHYQNITFPTIH